MVEGDKISISIKGYTETFTFIGGGATVLCFALPSEPGVVYLFVGDLLFNDGSTDEDKAKDAMVSAYSNGKLNPYLPKIKYVTKTYVQGEELNKSCKIYKMIYYRGLERSDKEAFVTMKVLHKLRADGMKDVYEDYRKKTGKVPSLTFLGNFAAKRTLTLAKQKLKNKKLVQALALLYAGIIEQNKPGLTFEFNRQNVGVDTEGHLILRDPVYCAEISVKIKRDRRASEVN